MDSQNPFAIELHHSHYSSDRIAESIHEILNKNELLSMATVTPDETAWINTAYFAFNDKLQLFIMTYPSSVHGKNVEYNNSVAINIFDSSQYAHIVENKQGIQMSGECHLTPKSELQTAIDTYSKRYSWLKEHVSSPEDFHASELMARFYTINIHYIKIFDEARFGSEKWVEVSV